MSTDSSLPLDMRLSNLTFWESSMSKLLMFDTGIVLHTER